MNKDTENWPLYPKGFLVPLYLNQNCLSSFKIHQQYGYHLQSPNNNDPKPFGEFES